MNEDAFSLTHLSRPPLQAAEGAPPALLLLHGVGSNEDDLMGLAPYLDPRLHLLSVRAPITLGPGMYGWYVIQMQPDGEFRFSEEEARWSLGLIRRFVDEAVAAYGLDARRLYVGGFSQGAIQGSALMLTEPDAVAGLVAMSGRWPTPVDGELAPPERLAGKPVLAVHGLYDPVIPIRYARELRARWSSLPVDLTYREFPMQHNVSMDSLALVRTWLATRLDESA